MKVYPSYRIAIDYCVLDAGGCISYGDALSIAELYGVKLGSVNRYLQNDSIAGRVWGFRNLDMAGKLLKSGKGWVYKKMTVKAFAKFKREMKKVIFK